MSDDQKKVVHKYESLLKENPKTMMPEGYAVVKDIEQVEVQISTHLDASYQIA